MWWVPITIVELAILEKECSNILYNRLPVIHRYYYFPVECSLGCRNGGRSNAQCNGCICPRQITGAFCENVPNPCEPNPCNNGTCRALSFTNFTCTCPPGFTGRNCSTKLNPCEPNPCRNNGVCMPAGTYPNFTCTCPPRFTGRLCETDICSSITCLNGGLCEILNGRAVCRCSANFNGSRCENCTIPNCRRCSTILTGVCLECERGFALANGRCCEFFLFNGFVLIFSLFLLLGTQLWIAIAVKRSQVRVWDEFWPHYCVHLTRLAFIMVLSGFVDSE